MPFLSPYTKDADDLPPHLAVGTRVTHVVFGQGKAVSYDTKTDIYTVEFDKHGKKELLLSFAAKNFSTDRTPPK